MAALSQYLSSRILNHITGKSSFTMPPKTYLALCTALPTSASTGSTIVEPVYTGYARIEMSAAHWEAAVEGTPSKILNEAIIFANMTGGTPAKVKAVALLDSLILGNLLAYCAVNEFEITATATPAQAIAKAIEITLE